MFRKIIMAALYAAITTGNAVAADVTHDPYTDGPYGQWTPTSNAKTVYDAATLYHAENYVAVWARIDSKTHISHGAQHDREFTRVAIVCQSHVYALISVSLFNDGKFVNRQDYAPLEIAQSLSRYSDTSPVGAIAAEICH